MEHKNSMSRVERLHREKVTRYSIRKYSFGAASVAVAALFMFLGNGAVSANELSKQDTPSVEAPALNKTQLESYISEIETKLSNGSYDNKTEESVAVLKADLETAKATLANATTQAELTKAYNKLVMTVNSGLKNKPTEKKETPSVDTTNGQPTVGKKADNTEPTSGTNSIENTGSKDSRNGQALDKNNAFRAETPETSGNFKYSMEYSNGKKDIYLYNEEEADVNITVSSTAGNITKATVKAGSGQFVLKSKSEQAIAFTKYGRGSMPPEEEVEIDGYGWSYRQTLTETEGPVTIKITGKPNDEFKKIDTYTKTENQEAILGSRFLQLKDSTNAELRGGRGASDPGYFKLIVKSQTYKYDIQQPESNADKIAVSNVDNLTEADIIKIKNELKIKYSDKATTEDARLASKRGEVVNPRSSVVKEIAVANGTVTVTYNDDSVDTAPVSSVARTNETPTVSIPFSDPTPDKKDIYIYNGEEVDIDITFNDDSGKIQSAALKRGGNIALTDIGENKQNNEWGLVTTVIKNETTTPATIKITGTVTGLKDNQIPKTESQAFPIVSRFATATDLDGKEIKNQATKFNPGTNIVSESYKTDPGAFTITLKAQTAKYDIKTPASADKLTVSDANNISDEDFEKIKAKVKIEYSNNNIDMRLADKKGTEVENPTERVERIEREGNNVVVTYKDGSKDTKALADFVNVAPKVALPYSNEANKQIYVYTGENTDLTFKGTDENEVKDLYLRGPGDISGNNAAGYGLPTGKVENGAVTGEGSVSEDKRAATIKMTGKTNLPAGQQWTSFIVSKDNDGKLSNTDYRALDKDPNARQKPGYAHFLVKNQTFKYDIATPTEKVAVTDPANVTQDELDKIKEKLQIEYSKRNDDANLAEKKGKAVDAEDAKTKIKSVEKDANGNLVVTYTDGSTDKRPLSDFVAKNPEVTPVKDPANLTDAEKTKVEEAVKKANPTATKVEVGNDGTTTVTFPDGSTASLTPEKTAKTADSNGLVDPEVTPVKDPANLTDAEKTKVEEAVKKANPTATKVEVGNDGTTTVTFPDGSTAKLTPEKTAKTADSNGLVDPEVTPVKDPANLTDAEKTKVEEAVKKANPTATKVEVGNDGTTTVTFPDGSTAKLTPEKTAKTADSNGLVDPEVTPVKDPANLTDAEKTKVEEAVKKANPTATKVEVGNDGTTTVTFPDGSTAKLTPEKTAKTADSNGLVDPEVTPVKDPANLTDAEKTKVEEAVKKANPTATKVEVGNDGTTTVTFPDGSTAKLTPEKTAKTADSNGLVDPEVTPVKDPANLTDAEKTKVEEAVKKANPTATKVEVGNDGTTTVTFPDGSTAKLTPEKTAKTADSNGLVDPEVTPVKDPANLTDAEKAKVEEAAKKANPTATKVEVGNDGTATVTFPDGSTAEIPAAKAVEKAKDAEGVKDPEVTPVKDPANLTDAEKAKVEEAVKKANPTAKDVEVGNDGTTTVTFPDGSTANLTPEKTAKTADSNGLVDPEVTPVKDPANLTDAEKAKVEEAVKKANPTAKDVEVGKDGTTTVTFPDGSTASLTPEKTAKTADSNGLVDPEVTPVKDPANLTDAEKTKVEEAVKKANPTATKVEVGNDGTTTVTFPDGSTASLTPEKTAKTADSNGLVDPEVTPVKDPANLTDAEKTKVEEAVKKANPTATKVEVGNDGTTTVTFPDGSTASLTPEKTAKTADSNGLVDPEVTPVKDPANLTDAEKTKVEEAVKKANPTATKVEVGKDGTTTVTFPDGSTAKLTPEKTAKTADSNGLVDPEVTPVKDPANLTDAEKTKVEEAVKKANPTATKVEVGNDGTTTVTFPDGSTAKLTPEKTAKTADSNGLVDPEVTPVKDPANLTDAEKTKVEEAVKKANPTATKVEVGNDGTTTVTFPDGSTAKLTPEKTAKTADSNGLVDPEVTPVKDPANLTDAEKAKVEEAAKKANPTATKVEVGNDGTATVTFPDGSTAEIPAAKAVEKAKDAEGVKDPEVTPVKDPANLTDAEKAKVEEAVKKANPTAKDVEVGNDGTTTVTFPDGSTANLTPEKTAKTADSNGLVDPEVTPVKDPANLTDAEKAKVEEAVKKANPTAKDVEVGKDGTTTVTFPDGSTASLTPEKTAKTADSNGLVDPEVTPVKDPANLTDAEKTKVEEAVKKANPTATKVEVGNDGTTTVTFPDGSTASLTPEKTAKTADSNGLVDPEVTPVKDPANLTDAEKTKVEEAVKKANPTATKVEVGNDGTTTVTFPDGSTASLTPEKTAKTADSNGLVDPEVTPVKDPANLTDAEKTKVEEAVKKANPTATKVEVGNDGTATVTFPDGSTAEIPAAKAVEKAKDAEGVKDPEVTPVKDPANLTDAEKTKVEEAVKKANPTATKVEVGNDGTTTVTFPDGSTAKLTPEKTAKTADSNGLVDPEVTPVKDPANLTDAEKTKVEEAVKKANPTATKVEVGNDGTTTVTFPDGSTAKLTPEKTAKTADSNGLVDPEVTPVKDPANLTDAEKTKVEEAVKKANPTATKVEVGNDGTTTVTFPDGSTAKLTPEKTAKTADSNGLVDPEVTPVKDPANLTDAEKAKVEEAAKKANPTATKVEVGNDGTATVTFPDGSTAEIPAAKAVEKAKDAEGVKDPEVTPVKDPANLTDAEKAKVEEAVKKANPTAKDVEVGNDGTTTVTFPDGSTANLTPEKTAKTADSNGLVDPEVTPVKDPANLTDAEKAKVEEAVKKANPTAKDVEVGKDGTTTVTFPDGSTASLTPEKTAKTADSNGLVDPEVTPVKDPANLTDAEKTKVEEAVKKANPTATKVEVGNDGTTTVTFPDGSTASLTPEKTAKTADSNGLVDPEVTPVKDPANLTDAEKTKVEEAVKKANPTATKVEVGNDGTTTVTFPDGSTASLTPEKTAKTADSNGLVDPEVTPVKDPANLTDAEKTKVEEAVKKANPTATKVEVGNDGTTTVTFPDGSTASLTPEKTAKTADSNGLVDPEVTPVKDPANLTDAEKTKVEEAVKKANPTATKVEVGNDGTTTVTFPDGSTASLTPEKTAKTADSNGLVDPEVTPVKDPANLTDAEKTKVEEAVKKANPTATKVEVGNDGTTTVTFPDGSTANLTPEKTAKTADSNGLVDPEVTPVKDPANLTDAEKAKVEEAVKKANPTAKDVEVGKDGTTTVTFPDGSTASLTPEKTAKTADSNGLVDPEVTPVKDPANLTDAEKTKVEEAVKKANPTATKVEVGNDGTTTVTFPDGSTASLTPEKTAKTADSNGLVDPEVTPVKDPANLTDAEKTKVEEAVKKANPTATKVEVGNDGTTTVTFPDGSTASLTPEKTAKTADSNGLVDPEVTPVKDPANLTDAEKTKVEEAVKKANPTATKVEVGNDGTTTVTFPDGSTASLTPEKTAKTADSNGLVDPEVTPVKDPANLTDAEKTKVEEAVKKANPTATKVEVGNDGTTTVTFPDGSTASLTPEKTAKTADSNGLVDPEVTPVKDPANLTDAEKAKVEEAAKKANPTATKVEVGKDGTVTVTFPDGSTTTVTPDKTVKSADSNGAKDPSVTPVKDPANLTDAEKAKVADEVKKANPTAKDVEVGNDGTTTVTFPDGSTTKVTPDKTVKSADSNGVKDPEATPVKDPANLTDAEKAKVADEVKKSNPTAKDVKVGKDGTATVTFPDGTTTTVTPDKTVKSADSNGVKDPSVTPVKDPANLTDAEKAKVAEEVKKSNPTAKDVEVGKDGTTTVTFPDGSTTTVTPDKTVKSADSNGVKDPSVTPVKDPANLTDAEKAKVAEEVKKSNPTAKDVEVGKDGTTTVTFPDGSTTTVTPDKTVKSADSNGVKDPSVTPVKDPANLTDAEKAKVAEEVKKSNPTAKDVEVGKDGTTTVTFPDGSTTTVTPDKTVKSADSNGVKDPSVTPVKDPANLTDAEKAKVAEEVKKSNPTAKDVEVGKDGTTTVTFPDGSTTTVTPDKTVKSADSNGVKDPSVTPVKDPANLTDAEKAKVAEEVKKSNPTAKDVEVGKDGTTTVTFPDGSTTTVTPDKTVKSADSNGVKDPSVTPVKDPANLTDAEKAKVAEEVKKSNPTAKDVEVGKDGTTTVTFPDGSTTTVTPDKTVKSADSNGVKDPSVTPVKDPANLTDAEKAKVAEEVKKSNPTAKDVEVGKDGTTTVTFPDGSTAVIPADKAVAKAKDAEGVQNPSTPATDAGKNTPVAQDQTAKPANKSKDSEGVKAPSATSVKDPSNLTDAEKAKVADEVKKSNPTATDVKVGKDGTTTVTFPDGSTAVIPADKAVAKANDSEGVKDPSATAVKDPSNLTDADKAKAASNASQAASAQANARKVAKELPNTGTADSTVAMVAAAASALLGLGLAGRRRKEDEEA